MIIEYVNDLPKLSVELEQLQKHKEELEVKALNIVLTVCDAVLYRRRLRRPGVKKVKLTILKHLQDSLKLLYKLVIMYSILHSYYTSSILHIPHCIPIILVVYSILHTAFLLL